MIGLLENYSAEIKYIIDQKLDNKQTIKKWNNILNNNLPSAKLVVNPLCSTQWNQDGSYNDIVEQYTETGVYTGCVATAMGQIMKKWNYPATGIGIHTYTEATYGQLSVNYGGTSYAWTSMPNSLTGSTSAQKIAIGTLLYHCGVAVNMEYTTSGSGASAWYVPDALIDHFGYQSTAEVEFQSLFSNANWINMLKAELDAGRPLMYSGDDGTSGHAFVFDGYNAYDQFHVNWGWSGYYDGYFTIGSLNPGSDSFNNNNSAVIRIQPPSVAARADFKASTIAPSVGATVTFTDLSANNPVSWTWNFEGGSPSTYSGPTPPPITYSTAGTYYVSLAVSNASGSDMKIKPFYIEVGGTPSAWIKQNTGFSKPSQGIRQISIVDANVAWAAAYNGINSDNPSQDFTRTVDGGNTWIPGRITFAGSENYSIANFHAMSQLVCYACMFPSGANGGYIVKSVDGGSTWGIQTSANFSTSWADFVHFFDANNGVCVGDPPATPNKFVIYTTSNGGTTWTQVNPSSLPTILTGETAIVDQFDAVGNTIFFGTSKGKLFKSTDKGVSWTAISQTTLLGAGIQTTPVFKDASTGIVFGVNASTGAYAGMKKTVNGGNTWSSVTPAGYFVKYPHIDFVPGTASTWVNVSAGAGTGSSYSTNDCSAFINIDTGSVQYTCVEMYDMNTGWAGGFNESDADGGIYKWVNPLTVGTGGHDKNSGTIQVFPNPTDGHIYIQFSVFASEKAHICVYNMIGGKVLEKEFDPSFDILLPLDLMENEPGIYLVTVQTGSEITAERVMLVH